MSEMPTRVQIGPTRWLISTDPQLLRDTERESGFSHNRGACQPNRGRIVIAQDTHPDQKRDTLLHEILHALHDMVGWSSSTDQEQERQVDTLSSVLLDTLRRNPALVAYLMTEDSGE